MSLKQYAFSEDSGLPLKKSSAHSPALVDENHTYWIDDKADLQTALYPELLHRAFRRKRDVSLVRDYQWQYCLPDKAMLINYDIDSYRLMCDEVNWLEVGKNTLGDIELSGRNNADETALNQATVEWDCGLSGSCNFTNKPAGINSDIKSNATLANHFFIEDANQSPYDGWEYFYNANHHSTIAVPPTLAGGAGYPASSIRNAPPQVRQHQSYLYHQPSYSSCSGSIEYDSTGNPIGEGAQTVDNAIMFITAGKPFMDATYRAPTDEMDMSLTRVTDNSLAAIDGGITCPTDGDKLEGAVGAGNLQNNFWCEIGEYSKRLRQADKSTSGNYGNPANTPVKTSVFLFARPSISKKLIATSHSTDKGTTYQCADADDKSIENACKLGQYGEGYGEGGFFLSTSTDPTQSHKELANAIIKMADNLSADMGIVPTSMPVMPTDPMRPDRLLSHGYLPLIAPKTGTSQALWQGNLRKYRRTKAGFTDEQGMSPFSKKSNASLSVSTRDIWAKEALAYPSRQQAGGAYSQIPMPTSATSDTPRNVYVNEGNSNNLTRYTPSNIGNLSVAGVPNDELRTLMLNYMGYKISDYQTGVTTLEQITSSYSSGTNKSLGGVYHSIPIALIPKVSNKKFSDATTTPTALAADTYQYRQQYVLFGAMDNALHVVNDKTGEEVFSFFPQEVLAHNGQYKAITPKLNASSNDASPSFGVDGPWAAHATYDYRKNGNNIDETTIIADSLFVYGGARLGARAYYGLDLTGLDKVKSANNLNGFAPKQLFSITPDSAGFERLGYTWAKPVITQINWQGQRRLVAILSGGYDASEYDKTDAQRLNDGMKASTLGNAIYIVDAKTGHPLVIATQGGTERSEFARASNMHKTVSVYNSHLKFSITSAVKTLDRDNDELTDHLYFTDLNGQVFRMDIDNTASAPAIGSKAAINTKVRVVRIAELSDSTLATTERIAPRFYETPTVTIQQTNQQYSNQRFTTVTVASGDRSNPLNITDPTAQTAVLTVSYIDKSGSERTLTAIRKIDPNRINQDSWVVASGFSSDGSLDVASLTRGSLKIPATIRRAGTSVKATTTFLSTETASAQLNTNHQNNKSSPLAPNIIVSNDGSATITLMTTDALSEGLKSPNYVYTIYDKDVGSANVFTTPSANLQTKDITYSSTEFPTITDNMSASDYIRSDWSKSGWRAPLNFYGSGLNNRNNAIKAMGPTAAVANRLYVTAYNPTDGQTNMNGCQAQVIGSTEIYQFCLPFGVCAAAPYNTPFQRVRYGKGLLPLSWSSSENGMDRQLITQGQYVTAEDELGNQQSSVQTVAQLNSVNGNTAPIFAQDFGLKGALKPMLWFDYGRYVPE